MTHFSLATVETPQAMEGYAPIDCGTLYFKAFGEGETIIVIHGGPGLNHNHFLPQMLPLAQKNKLVFYDQRGAGKSLDTAVDETTMTVDQFVEDLERLRQHLGAQKCILLGHSWGGFLALSYAIKYPDRIASLILMSSQPATSDGLNAFYEEINRRITPVKDKIASLRESQAFKEADPTTIADYYRLFSALYCHKQSDADKLTLNYEATSTLSGFKVGALFEHTTFSKPYDLRENLKKLNIPTLIIHGDHDPIPLWTAREIQGSLPNTELVIVKDCGHFPYIEQSKVFLRS